jgi:tetratricopeptide (TPR) repeat protein
LLFGSKLLRSPVALVTAFGVAVSMFAQAPPPRPVPAAAAAGKPPELGQLDASPALFTVLAAINAAGYNAGMDSPSSHFLRKAIRDEIAKRKTSTVDEIRGFMMKHRQEDANWELRQYISFGLLVDGPPKFEFRLRDNLLPPDIAAMSELNGILVRFYKEANIEELWQRSQPAIEKELERYHEPATKTIAEVSAYLRVPLGVSYLGRRFQILIELLGAPNQIHHRSFLDDYFLVLTHSAEPQVDEIRTAYLRFLLDPLATKYSELIDQRQSLSEYAQRAPFLADHYKDDFLLLTTTCLTKAVEARLTPGGLPKRQEVVFEAMTQGYILTAFFYEQLPLYEKQEQGMRLYYPDLIKALDPKKEARRIERIEFAKTAPVRKAKAPPPPPPVELSAGERTFEEAEARYRDKDYEKARALYARVMQQSDDRPLQGKAYYGLARIAAQSRDPELAVKLFEKALEVGPPAPERAWTLVYLARLSEASGEPDAAAKRYREALEVPGATEAARKAAEQGLQKIGAK